MSLSGVKATYSLENAEVVQLVEASGLEPECWEFESPLRHSFVLGLRIVAIGGSSDGCGTGSIPVIWNN